MRAYFVRRLLLIIPTLLVLSILVFLSARFIPGEYVTGANPVTAQYLHNVDQAIVA